MSNTFRNGGYAVTVNDDRSIHVKQGDWLSKYSMAIYNDFEHIHKFKKKEDGQYKDVPNPNLILTGDILYHPDPLPGESVIPPGTGVGEPEPPIQAGYVSKFVNWGLERFWTTDWSVGGTGGFDASLIFFTGQYLTIEITHTTSSVNRWFHLVGSGGVIGYPESVVGFAGSTTHFKSVGRVLRSPLRAKRLTFDDFRHGALVLELGGGYWLGGAITLVYFGIGAPLLEVAAQLNRYFRYGVDDALEYLFLTAAPNGILGLAGLNATIPGGAVAARLAFMYDRGYVGL